MPSGLVSAGVVFLVSVLVVVVCSDEVVAGGVTTVVPGGGACWQPASIKQIAIAEVLCKKFIELILWYGNISRAIFRPFAER